MNVQETLRLIKTLRAIQPAQVFDDETPEVWQALLRNVDLKVRPRRGRGTRRPGSIHRDRRHPPPGP